MINKPDLGMKGLNLTNIIIAGTRNTDSLMKNYYNNENHITMPFDIENIDKRAKHSYLTLTERIALELRNFKIDDSGAIDTVDVYLQDVDVNTKNFYKIAKRVIYFSLGTQVYSEQPSITKICWGGLYPSLKSCLEKILKEVIETYDSEYTCLNHYEETHEKSQPISFDGDCLNYYDLKISLQSIDQQN